MDGPGELKPPPSVGGSPTWEPAAVFAAATGAELARQQLEAEGIPVALLSDRTGIFGPGFVGPSAQAITLMVPSGMVDEALEIIDDILEAFGGSVPGTS